MGNDQLYAALARATAQASARFAEVRDHLRQAQRQYRDAEALASDAEKRAGQADRRASTGEKRLASAEATLRKRQVLLDRADALRAAGFTEKSLVRLGAVLDKAAQAEGKTLAEVVAAFLEVAEGYGVLAELRAALAEAEKAAREAEEACGNKQVQAKVRSVAVDSALWLMRQGITADTVRSWQAIAGRAGLDGQDLASGLAQALELHGDRERVRKAWADAVARLRAEHRELIEVVDGLRRERDALTAGIAAVRRAGIQQIRSVANEATAKVRLAAADFEALTTKAAALRQHVRMAEALSATDAAAWRDVEPTTWEGMLLHLPEWAEARQAADAEVEVPQGIRKRVEDQAKYPALHGPVRLTLPQLVGWLTTGLRDRAQWAVPPDPEAGRADGGGGR